VSVYVPPSGLRVGNIQEEDGGIGEPANNDPTFARLGHGEIERVPPSDELIVVFQFHPVEEPILTVDDIQGHIQGNDVRSIDE